MQHGAHAEPQRGMNLKRCMKGNWLNRENILSLYSTSLLCFFFSALTSRSYSCVAFLWRSGSPTSSSGIWLQPTTNGSTVIQKTMQMRPSARPEAASGRWGRTNKYSCILRCYCEESSVIIVIICCFYNQFSRPTFKASHGATIRMTTDTVIQKLIKQTRALHLISVETKSTEALTAPAHPTLTTSKFKSLSTLVTCCSLRCVFVDLYTAYTYIFKGFTLMSSSVVDLGSNDRTIWSPSTPKCSNFTRDWAQQEALWCSNCQQSVRHSGHKKKHRNQDVSSACSQ